MKIKLLPAFFLVLVMVDCPAQIVLTTADFPVIGDQSIMRELDSTSQSPGPAGAGQSWNFSSLTGGHLDTTDYVNPATTPNGAAFPTATVCAMHGDNYYDYYSATAGGMKLVGFDGDEGVINLVKQGYIFPLLTYGNSVAHSFRAKLNVVSADTYDAVYIAQNSTADAWGTITTPAGTANVLRIYTTEMRYDSSYVGGVGTQTGLAPGYYYQWYAKGLGWPVMEIAHGALSEPDFERVFYATNLSGITAVSEVMSDEAGVSVFPNPFNGAFTLSTSFALANAQLGIYDLAGQQVYLSTNLNGTNAMVQAGTLKPGAYFYRLTNGEGTVVATGKLLAE